MNTNRRGKKDNNKQNFANKPELAKENGKKGDKTSSGVSHAVQGVLTTGKHKIITPEIQQYIRDELLTEDDSGTSYVLRYIRKFFAQALKDPNCQSGRIMSGILFKENLLDTLDMELNKEKSNNVDMMLWKINNTLYDKQQEVFSSFLHNAYKRYLIINSRRTGKTELMGRLIVANLISSNDAHVVYINRNSSAAIRQIKKPLTTALAQTDLQIIKGSVESQFIEFNNGSQLLILGNNNSADIDKTRGERISLCIMDECGHQRNTRQIIREVIEPAMADYGKDAKLVLVGTPPRIPHTYIEDVYNNAISLGWQTYHWTYMDNPHLPDRDLILDDVCKSNGVTPDSAFIQREYFGRMDAYDDDAKWIKKYSEVEMSQLPKVFTHAYVGVDWGYEDRAAVISVLADEVTKRAYVVDCWSEARKGIVEISNEIKRQAESLKQNFNISRPVQIICDNNEKGAVSDLVNVYKLRNVFTAYKYDKDMALDQLNDFLGGNRITFLKDKAVACVEDANNTLWKRDEETDKILHEIDDDVWHPNALMALLYVSRQFALDVCRFTDINKQARNILSGKGKDEDLEEVYNPIESEEEII